ncbi:BatD family protein [Sulfurimonas sp.]|uniref:BatD family protein n=1 Tax=Sulfurimonas sp. TaxID=2022749 RepID=UPI0035697C2A
MKNLGRILIFLTFLTNILNASVVASVDAQKVVKGEMVTLSLKLDGDDIEQPNIQTICGEDIISTNSQTSVEMINGNYNKTYILSYKFLPQKSCEIKPIAIKIGGKTEYTKPIKIDVSDQIITKDSQFVLSLKSSKDEVYVGEGFEVTLLFKQKNNANAVDSKFIPPNLQGFWVKSESKPERYKEDDYTVTKVVYKLAAQREGSLKISQAQIKIASRVNTKDSWGYLIPQVKWRTYFSNELNIDVKQLPSGVDLVGEFEIEAEIDKNSIKQNEAVNLTLKVKGEGNLEDIKTLKPEVEGVSIFDEKVDVSNNILTQKIAFVSEHDFVIPSISLRYFNPKTKEIKTIKTKEFKIEVKGSETKDETLNIKRQETNDKSENNGENSSEELSIFWMVTIFVLGVIVGMAIMLFKTVIKSDKKDSFDIKDEKMLLVKLLPYESDDEVKKFINKIESNIYSTQKEYIDKKELKNLLKRLGIS